jgi:NDP-sugar pyrophosphorylase family protein
LDFASVDEDPYREEWERSFAVIEPGADVADSATIHDSVVLAGASVGKDAVVVRSVVCPGAVVGAGTRCVGQVVGPAGGGKN